MYILGISAFYHDSAACLLHNGEFVAAAQEERFTRTKHDHRFPELAIEYCLGEAGIGAEELDFVAFYDKPLLKFERLLETYVSFAPVGFRSFLKAMPLWLKQKLHIPREIDRGLKGAYKGRYIFAEHHLSHAASAFYPSPFEEAAILTMDGVGEWATASIGYGEGNKVELTHELRFPHSLGLLYTAFTYYTGFKVNSGEYKLMGLAPYGKPRFADKIKKHLMDMKEDGSFRLDMAYFNYCQGLTMTSNKFHDLFGGPPRKPESKITQREMDLASSVQAVTEEIMIRIAKHARKVTGKKNLCLAGGVALNCVGNGEILRQQIFDNIWIQPASGDAGGALGAATFVWHQLMDKPRTVDGENDLQSGSLLGPTFSNEEIGKRIDALGAKAHFYEDEDELLERVADLLASEKVLGHFNGRMEFGPRALGSRSIIGDPRSREMQTTMNLKIKFRESFRPFAPSVMREHCSEWFDFPREAESPYMLLVADVHADKLTDAAKKDTSDMSIDKRLHVVRSEVPAITHVDNSARIQTVDPKRHGRYYKLISHFKRKTGCPVVVNTSFNIRGEPIVCTPEDAYRCFMVTNMDALVLQNYLLLKEEQPDAKQHEVDAHLAQFELD